MLEELKGVLKISGTRQDDTLAKYLERGKNYIQRLTGTTIDFDKEELPKQLLFDYCRYAYNDATEFFAANFATDILSLQLEEAIKNIEVSVDENHTEI